MLALRFSRWEFFFLLWGLALTVLYVLGHKIDGDVSQMLDRGILYYQEGVLLPYGPASTSGSSGFVPGSFLSWAVAWPMKIYFSPYSSLILLALLHLLAFFLLRSLLRPWISPEALLLFLYLFWLNPYRMVQVFLWNPGYMVLVSALHLWSCYHLHRRNKSFFWSLLLVLSLFLGLQVHISVAILVFATLILWLQGKIQFSWPGVFVASLIGLLSLLPFIQLSFEQPNLIPKPGNQEGYLFYGLLHVHPVLKGVWYWLLFPSFVPPKYIFHQTDFVWLGSFAKGAQFLFDVTKVFMAIFTFYFVFLANRWWMKNFLLKIKFLNRASILSFLASSSLPAWDTSHDRRAFLLNYSAVTFVSMLLATAISPSSSTQFWHVLYVMPVSIFVVVLFFDQVIKEPSFLNTQFSGRSVAWIKKILLDSKMLRLTAVTYFIYLTLFNVFAATHSGRHDLSETFHSRFLRYLQEKPQSQ